jgi:DNA-binding transcriptional LysR family regulator
MELKWLEDFIAVAKTGNFSRAAELRHVTQPAFSRRFKALERWFGAPLVDRSTYPVTLTPAGDAFLELAEQIVRDLHRVRCDARINPDAHKSVVRFAMPHALAVYFFPRWWRSIAAGQSVTAKVMTDDLNNCLAWLTNGLSHLLLCYHHDKFAAHELSSDDFLSVRAGEDCLAPVCAVDRKGDPLFSIEPASDMPIPVLGYTQEAFLGRVTADLFQRRGADVDLRYESALTEALKAEALMGGGIAWLPAGLIEQELANGELVRIGDQEWSIPLEIRLYRPSSAAHPAILDIWNWTVPAV